MPAAEHWDYVIAGGGTAGCVLARRLAERGARVVLLEAGGRYPRWLLGAPLPSLRLARMFSWRYLTAPQPGLGGRRISLPLGRLLGGSSSINAMMYCRGAASDYDGWASQGNEGWSFAAVLPYFLRAETWTRGESPWRGRDGPLTVSGPRFLAPFSLAFVEACRETGLPPNDDFNGQQLEGCGFFDVTQEDGERVSAARHYLGAAPAGISVVTAALVNRVLFDGSRATGVEYRRGSQVHRAFASGEVILSAGAVNSPKLLMLSGIGPARDLRNLGIEARQDLVGVGANLHDHVRLPVLYESHQVSPGAHRHWITAALRYVIGRSGVMSSNCCEAGAFARSSPEEPEPDLQFVTHFQSSLHGRAVDLQCCLLKPESRGRVTLDSADPARPPRIDPNYLGSTADVERLVRGVAMARRLARSKALAGFGLGREILPGATLRDASELAGYVRGSMETCYHPAGTCRMGVDETAVVDARLRVHGCQSLRVVDASVMPEPIRGNTLAPVVMIAEKAADMILPPTYSSHHS